MSPPVDSLERFIQAQDGGGRGRADATYADALAELRTGEKVSHWMWYVFPQLRGLGQTDRSHYYGIADLSEARAYLAHPVLGARLVECAKTLAKTAERSGRSAEEILGSLDALKLHASITLFDLADATQTVFVDLRWRMFHGFQHSETLALLPPGRYVFTEAVLAAAESTPRFKQWVQQAFGDESVPEHVHTYFLRKVGMTATNEDEMALMALGGNNMGGGVPADILRMLSRLSRISP